jgi:signal transduction histidine kinase
VVRLRLRLLDPRRLWLSQRGLLLLALGIVAAAIVTVFLLRMSARHDLSAALLANRLNGEISRLNGLETQAVEGLPPNAGRLRDELARSARTARSLVAELGAEGSPIQVQTDRYVATVTEELALLESDRVAEARALARSTVDPLYDRLGPQLNAVARRRAESAQATSQRASIGALVAILVTAAAVGGLLWKLLRLGEAARTATRERDHLRELDGVKDTVIATVSHELRTPLTSILGYTELMLQLHAGPLSEDQERCLRTIERNGNRLLRLSEDLLLLSRAEAGALELHREPVDLGALVGEAAAAHQPVAARAGVELLTDVEDAWTDGDGARLAQLVDNLVSNAIKFTPDGGRVLVTLRPDGGEAVLAVVDTGLGIATAEQEHLFERFYRSPEAADRAIQGTGLGLAIAKAVVEAHGGRISVESVPGDGSTFSVYLPAGVATARSAPAGEEVRTTAARAAL